MNSSHISYRKYIYTNDKDIEIKIRNDYIVLNNESIFYINTLLYVLNELGILYEFKELKLYHDGSVALSLKENATIYDMVPDNSFYISEYYFHARGLYKTDYGVIDINDYEAFLSRYLSDYYNQYNDSHDYYSIIYSLDSKRVETLVDISSHIYEFLARQSFDVICDKKGHILTDKYAISGVTVINEGIQIDLYCFEGYDVRNVIIDIEFDDAVNKREFSHMIYTKIEDFLLEYSLIL